MASYDRTLTPTAAASAPSPGLGVPVGPLRRPSHGAAAGVAVGAGDGVVPDDPPDPGRPGARGARADGAGRAGRGPREALGLDDPLLVQYLALPPEPASRRPRHLDRLAAPGLGRDRAAAAGHACPRAARVPRRGRSSPSRSASRWACSPAAATARRTELAFTDQQRRARARSPTSCSASASSTSSASASAGCRSPATTPRRRTSCPVLALAIGPAAILARIVRVEMVAVLEADFVRTARAKRLPARTRLPRPRAAQRADRVADARRPAPRRDGRRHRAGRERLRLARPRQHDRVVDPQQGLPGRAGASSSCTASACCS